MSTRRLGRIAAEDAPCVSDTLTRASFALGMIIPSGMSTSTTFTTPRRKRRLAAPGVSTASGAPSSSTSKVSWMGSPWSTNASFISWRERKFGALNTTVKSPSTRLRSRPNSLSGCPATSTRFTRSSSSTCPPTRMMDT